MTWWMFAFGSALAASATAILAKIGIQGVPSNLATAVRTAVVLLFAWAIVFATGERAEQARAAGADEVGGDELIDKVAAGYTDFDSAVATPDLMGKVLGPRGLMPNPKTGTVTMDVAKAVSDIKGGKITFRVDKQSNLHLIIGKASFTEEQLIENYGAALDEVLRSKPSSAKGKYLRKVSFSTTMGPGIPVDVNRTRNLAEDSASA